MDDEFRCVACGWQGSPISEVTCCPRCEYSGTPMLPSMDLTVRVNWHELRILGIWAERWAHSVRNSPDRGSEDMLRVVQSIAGRIEAQRPDPRWPPMTMSAEMEELRERFGAEVECEGDDAPKVQRDLMWPPKGSDDV